MKTVVFLPTQGPHLPRKGPPEDYDWRVQCRLAAGLLRDHPDVVVYVPSAFQQQGAGSEIEYYSAQLLKDGVPADALLMDKRGLETVEQCELALELAGSLQARLIAVSCAVQARRVKYLLRRHHVEHVIANGTPNPWLRFTHAVLAFLFPVIDAAGGRGWWKRMVEGRRQKGRQ